MIETIALIIGITILFAVAFVMFSLTQDGEHRYTAEPSSDKKEEEKMPALERKEAMIKEAMAGATKDQQELMARYENLSVCCNAPRKETHGCDSDFGHKGKCDCAIEGVTWWYECSKCKKPC